MLHTRDNTMAGEHDRIALCIAGKLRDHEVSVYASLLEMLMRWPLPVTHRKEAQEAQHARRQGARAPEAD